MKRRTFLKGAGTALGVHALGLPALAQNTRVLKYAPAEGLGLLDPHFTTVNSATNYGNMVCDTLYAMDATYQPKPQMVEGHVVSDDRLTWTLKLRAGLKFHDGEPVRAQDCVASIKRWGQRNQLGLTLMGYVEELTAPDASTIKFQLKSPFGILPHALATPMSSPCVIFPERIASKPITEQITESIGSGPFKFNKGDYVPGQRAIFERFADYVPRQDAPDGLAGARVAYFDRVEWNKIADEGTATAALQSGEVDWMETVNLDLVGLLRTSSGVTVASADPGIRNILRFNQSNAPFKDNAALRRAIASAIDQKVFTEALLGPNSIPPCYSMYSCTLKDASQLGEAIMAGPKDFNAIAAKVKEAGYNGERVVIISANDLPTVAPMGPVLFDVLKKIGINAELQLMDINTLVARRGMTVPTERGGWNIFLALNNTPLTVNPLSVSYARGLGAKGYPGSYDDPTLEQYIRDWIAAPDSERVAALNKVHARLWEQMPAVPLANYETYTAYRSNLTGRVQFVNPIFWGIRRV